VRRGHEPFDGRLACGRSRSIAFSWWGAGPWNSAAAESEPDPCGRSPPKVRFSLKPVVEPQRPPN